MRINFSHIIGGITSMLLLLLPFAAFADTQYVPLVKLPGFENTPNGNLPQYLNRLYLLTISIGSLIAVIKIIIAGVRWSFSDIVTDKSTAKSDIKGALLGLAILLLPALVLNTIYPNLTNLNFLENAPKANLGVQGDAGNGDWGTPIDYGTDNDITIPQAEFNSYSENDIYSWYERCGGNDKLRVSAAPGGNVRLSCGESNTTPDATVTPGQNDANDACGGSNCQDYTYPQT